MVDGALLDRHICESEADEIIAVAHDLGLSRAEAIAAHHDHLRALARAAWNDGVVTDEERHDIETVAVLIGLDKRVAIEVVEKERISGIRRRGRRCPQADCGCSRGGVRRANRRRSPW